MQTATTSIISAYSGPKPVLALLISVRNKPAHAFTAFEEYNLKECITKLLKVH